MRLEFGLIASSLLMAGCSLLFSQTPGGDSGVATIDAGASDGGNVHLLVVRSDSPKVPSPYVLYVDKIWPEGLAKTSSPCFTLAGETDALPLEWIAEPGSRLWAWVRLPELKPDLTIVVSPCVEVSELPVWDGFSGVWHLDEFSTADLAGDSSPNGNHGQQVGVSQADGKVGVQAKTMGGEGIVVADSTAPGDWFIEDGGLDMGPGSLSMSIWARFDPGSDPAPTNPSLLHKSTGPGGSGNHGYNLYMTETNAGSVFFTPFKAVEGGLDERLYFGRIAPNVLDRSWHHVALTFQRAEGADIASFFLDGQLLETAVVKSGAHSSQKNSEPFHIGKGNLNARAWVGDLDEARIGPGVWTPEQIAADFRSQNNPGGFLSWQ